MRLYLESKIKHFAYTIQLILDSNLKIFCLCYILVTISLTSGIYLLCLSILIITLATRRQKLVVILISVALATLLCLKFNTELTSEKNISFERTYDLEAVVLESESKEFNQVSIIKSDLASQLILAKLPKYPLLSSGDEIKISGKISLPKNTNEFDYIYYLHSKKIYYIIEQAELKEIIPSNSIRNKIIIKLNSVIDHSLGSTESSLLKGILYGDKSNFSNQFDDNLRNSGLSHIVSVSGYNFVIIYSIAVAILVSIFRRRTSQVISISLIIGFLILVGTSNIPALRATIMILFIVIASIAGRKPSTVNLILVSVVLLLIEYPLNWTNISFLLSFASLIGLLALSEKIKATLSKSRLPDQTIEIISATIAVTISTAFISISVFQNFSFIALLSNLLVLPLIPIIMGLGAILIISSILNIELIFSITSNALNLLLSYLKVIISTLGGDWSKDFPIGYMTLFLILSIIIFLLIHDYKKFNKKT